jgi:hypothetical protein
VIIIISHLSKHQQKVSLVLCDTFHDNVFVHQTSGLWKFYDFLKIVVGLTKFPVPCFFGSRPLFMVPLYVPLWDANQDQ